MGIKFRVQTVSYQENVDPEVYGTDDPIEAALAAQEELRNTDEPLIVINDVIGSEATVFVSVFDPGGMMFTDEFVKEVIQIVRVERLHIDIRDTQGDDQVRVEFAGVDLDMQHFESIQYGRAIGQALRKVREDLRAWSGK